MQQGSDSTSQFYSEYFKKEWKEKLTVECPFCRPRGFQQGRLSVILNRTSFFHGYFRCSSRCVPGGFPLWFARLASIPLADVPGYVQENDVTVYVDYPVQNLNEEVRTCHDNLTDEILELFEKRAVLPETLAEVKIGFNGRYLMYPYFQEDGNCYSARCVHPERAEDFFWHGNDEYTKPPFNLFNFQEISRCENGTVFLCEGEENVLTLKQLGFPAVGVFQSNLLEKLSPKLFSRIETVFISTNNKPESENNARNIASRLGHKARILNWPANSPRDFNLWELAEESGSEFGAKVAGMVRSSKAFSPFTTPAREYIQFQQTLKDQRGEEYKSLYTGFSRFDEALGGVYGINVIGGAPKVGKSTFMIQIGAQMALRRIPVLYYDFENGRQKIYQRTVSRLSKVPTAALTAGNLNEKEVERVREATERLKNMLYYWRVINDRKITPELMRKHIEFIRHETRSNYTIVVVDSLHKLPFNEFTERRTGIDAWLRQMESIRDELQVSFLVISELSRGGGGSYEEEPHLGVFKGSGDIEYSADNAMVLYPESPAEGEPTQRTNTLWLVASREHSPGRVANYRLDYPFWGFEEKPLG